MVPLVDCEFRFLQNRATLITARHSAPQLSGPGLFTNDITVRSKLRPIRKDGTTSSEPTDPIDQGQSSFHHRPDSTTQRAVAGGCPSRGQVVVTAPIDPETCTERVGSILFVR